MNTIGKTVFWVESYTRYGKAIPCPMCFGKQFVTIILGDGSSTQSECGMCSHGLDRATGQAKVWEPTAFIKSGVVTGMSTRDGIKYEIGYQSISASQCFETEEEAKPELEKQLKEVKECAEHWYKDNFIQCKKTQLWSAGYHRGCIESAERNIAWHKARLGMIKDKLKESK